jgi:type VI secretion system secreted protein VgrG
MASDLTTAEQDADGSFWYDDVGGAVQGCSPNPPPKRISQDKKHWVEIAMVDKEGNPTAGQDYEITLPDGSVVTGSLDDRGVARVEGIDPGNCKIRFPSLDKTVWKRR